MAKNSKIRVLIADDHAILRSGLRMLIDAQADMTVVAEAQNGNEAIQVAQKTTPDVVILDVTMPERGGLHAIRDILKNDSNARILLLTMHEDPAYLRTLQPDKALEEIRFAAGLGLGAIWVVLSIELFIRGLLIYARFVHGGWKQVKV